MVSPIINPARGTIIHRSNKDTVSILPKRKPISSTLYPGVRSMSIMPSAIPTAQITPMVASALCLLSADTAAITAEERTVNPRVDGITGRRMK